MTFPLIIALLLTPICIWIGWDAIKHLAFIVKDYFMQEFPYKEMSIVICFTAMVLAWIFVLTDYFAK